MDDKFPKIYKNKISKIKSKVQNNFYYHSDDKSSSDLTKGVVKSKLLKKINDVFLRPNYVYQADVIIMFKNGENKHKKIVGLKDDYIITLDNEKIKVDDVLDIK